jgi:predicted O-methyltransferase YrrM
MAESAYDLVFIDLDPTDAHAILEHAVALAKPGGAIVIAHALWRDRVPDPTLREDETGAMRTILESFADNEGFIASLSMVGDGLLFVVKK